MINNDYVENNDSQPHYYRSKNCFSNSAANRYQIQKQIQNTVRVDSSVYTMNLGSLSAYKKPPIHPYGGVCWNQMSDRPFPSVQKTYVPTGSNCSLNKKHTSVTSSRPGGQSPGGIGCDIKHNSYDRYLNRLKGKSALRRGTMPPDFNAPEIPFNRAYPIYGGKVMKTNIITGCNCFPNNNDSNNDSQIYNNDSQIYNKNQITNYNTNLNNFGIGDNVYAIPSSNLNKSYAKATILSIQSSEMYEILFEDGTIEEQHLSQLKFYIPFDSKCCDDISNKINDLTIYGIDYVYEQFAGQTVF